MWSTSSIVAAFVVALAAMSIGLAGGAVVVAVPLAILGIAIVGLVDLRRRRKQAQMIHTHREQARTEKVDFTPRDQETLVSDDQKDEAGRRVGHSARGRSRDRAG
jgi:hypothetical protein